MSYLHNPSFGLESVQFNGFFFFAARTNMRCHAVIFYDLGFTNVSGIKAKILRNLSITVEIQWPRASAEQFSKNRTVMPIGAGHDERQRDAMRVD